MKKIIIPVLALVGLLTSGSGCKSESDNVNPINTCATLTSSTNIYDVEWIADEVEAKRITPIEQGFVLKGIYQQNTVRHGIVYAFYHQNDNVVGGPGKHDMFFNWFDCEGNLLCFDDGDMAINDCGYTQGLTVPVFEEGLVFWPALEYFI